MPICPVGALLLESRDVDWIPDWRVMEAGYRLIPDGDCLATVGGEIALREVRKTWVIRRHDERCRYLGCFFG